MRGPRWPNYGHGLGSSGPWRGRELERSWSIGLGGVRGLFVGDIARECNMVDSARSYEIW